MEVDTVMDMMGDMVKKIFFFEREWHYYTWLVASPI